MRIFFKKSFVIDKLWTFVFLAPLFAYAGLQGIHLLFGADLTGGWLREPRENPRLVIALAGIPVLSLVFGKSLAQYFSNKSVLFMVLEDEEVHFNEPRNVRLSWRDFEKIRVEGHSTERKIVFYSSRGPNIIARLRNIDMPRKEFLALIKQYSDHYDVSYEVKRPWNHE